MPLNPDRKSEQSGMIEGEDLILHLIETARGIAGNEPEVSKDFFEKALSLSKRNGFYRGVGDCLVELARIHLRKENTEAALQHYREANDYFHKAGHFEAATESLLQITSLLQNQGSYDQAITQLLSGLDDAVNRKDLHSQGLINNRLGEIIRITGDYEKALNYHQNAYDIFRNNGEKAMECITSYHIGNTLNWSNNLTEAAEFLERALDLAEELNDTSLSIRPTGSLAALLVKTGDYDRAEELFFKAIDLVSVTPDRFLKADLLKNLAQLYIVTGKYEEAISALQQSLSIIEELKFRYPTSHIHLLLSEIYEKTGDQVKALFHYKLHSSLTNELLNEEIRIKSRNLQLLYDFDQVKRQKESAEEEIVSKNKFIAGLSHEIRTPLSDILGMSGLLADTNPTAEQSEYIETIRLSANNLIQILDNILDFSRLQRGEVNIEQREIVLKELVASIVQSMKVKADEKYLDLQLKLDQQLPEKVIGDDYRTGQILQSLISNAIRFTDKGSVSVKVELTEYNNPEAKILFTISDTGVGISQDRIDRIFESFTTSEPVVQGVRLTGIGLAIVKQLTGILGGTISVSSVVSKGSVFKVELPFRLTQPLQKKPARPRGTGQVPLKDLSDIVILLVEDNKVNQFLAQKLLHKMGFHVGLADNGPQAIELLKKQAFHVILMDVQMPDMNGYQLTKLIRTTLPDPINKIPVIALTAYASAQEKEHAKEAGMNDYLTKPYSPHELLAAVLKQVQNTGHQQVNGENGGGTVTPSVIRESTEKLLHLFSNNREDVISLFRMLLNQIPQLLDETSAFINDKNWQATFHALHRIKSSITLLKVNTLRDRLAELEEWTRDEVKTERIPIVFGQFREGCLSALDFIRQEMLRLKKEGAD